MEKWKEAGRGGEGKAYVDEDVIYSLMMGMLLLARVYRLDCVQDWVVVEIL